MQEEKRNIVWLASYAKSGNSWFRVFLSNLISGSSQPVNINELSKTPISSSRKIIDSYLGIHSSELTAEETDNLRPQVYKKLSEDLKDTLYLKTHDAWTCNSNEKPLFPAENTKGVIYIIRNPLDIAISYAFHNGESIDQTISILNNIDYKLCTKKDVLNSQTQQLLTSWSNHVISWVDNSKLPVHVIRYEDMLDQPLTSFKGALFFLEMKYGDSEIKNAIKNSSFTTMQKMEAVGGFKERSIQSDFFFRKGKSNEWRCVLSKIQIDEVIKYHDKIMKRFGYLNNESLL